MQIVCARARASQLLFKLLNQKKSKKKKKNSSARKFYTYKNMVNIAIYSPVQLSMSDCLLFLRASVCVCVCRSWLCVSLCECVCMSCCIAVNQLPIATCFLCFFQRDDHKKIITIVKTLKIRWNIKFLSRYYNFVNTNIVFFKSIIINQIYNNKIWTEIYN